ncbi:MAG: hypothetical protein JXA21_21455, partial [Anaerolineae bacterium]|nr:hypothetical protein [Anaerolineae bacterium]
YSVYLNNKKLDESVVSSGTLTETNEIEVAVAKLLADEANRLIIERQEAEEGQTGKGQLYYTAYLRYFLPTEEIPALDRGISIARQYEPVTVHPDAVAGEAWVGDVIRVNLTIVAQDSLYYVVLEDPFPAGCEAVDVSLKTTSMLAEGVEMRRESLNRWGYGGWWFSHTELRDEKLAMFASYLPRGTYQLSYYIRASVPGVFNVLPSMAYEMYFPEIFGRSDGMMFTVKSEETTQVVTFPTPTPRPTATPMPPTPTSTPGPTPTPLPFEPVLVEGVPAQTIRHMWTSPQGQLWLATEEGILVYGDGSWTTILASPSERILGTDNAGRVWAILDGGAAIAVFDGATWASYGAAQGWLPPAPTPLDAQGREITTPRFGVWGDVVTDWRAGVWLATGRDELRHLNPQSGVWETFTATDLGFAPVEGAIPGHMLTDVALDSFGNVWVGDCVAYNETLRGQGARWFNGETWSGSRDTVEECVFDIEVDGGGNVWLGGRFALTRYDPAAQAFAQIALPQWNTYQAVSDLRFDGQGGLWVELWRTSGGSYTQRALFLLKDGVWHTTYQYAAGASTPALQADGTAWFCARSSVSRARGGTTESAPYWPEGEPLPEEISCQVAVDGAGRVWLTDGMRLWTVRE